MKTFWGLLALLIGYSLAAAPFRAPDEFNHFFRAYQVSEGELLAGRPMDGIVGGRLPRSLMNVAELVADYPGVPSNTLRPYVLARAWRLPLEPEKTDIFHFPNTALYSPVVYLPATLGIILGRIIGAGPLLLFYLARFANAIAGAGCLAYATWRAGPCRRLFAIVALTPMALFEIGICGSDAVTFGIVFIWCSEWLALRRPGAVMKPARFLFLAVILSQTRPPYPLIALLAFAIPRSVGRRWGFSVVLLLTAFIPCLAWNLGAWHLQTQMRPGVITDSLGQLIFVTHHLGHFIALHFGECWQNKWLYAHELIGTFGWANQPLPAWVCLGFASVVGIAACTVNTSQLQLGWRPRLCLLGLSAAGCALVQLFLYMIWNAVGADKIEGVQGRYFIPFALMTILALANSWLLPAKFPRFPSFLVAAAVGANVLALAFLARGTF